MLFTFDNIYNFETFMFTNLKYLKANFKINFHSIIFDLI
jgi:hypothetical protein